MNRRVVITGLGMATSLGLNVQESWTKALTGQCGISKLTLPLSEMSPVQAVGEIKAADWKMIQQEFPHEAESEGERRTLFALWAAKEAFKDAGITYPLPVPNNYGVSIAAGLGINRLEDISRWLTDEKGFDVLRFASEYKNVHPESIMKNNTHRPASLIAKKYGLNGLNYTVTSACASATQAIGTAYRAIKRGDSDLMATGGADSMINPVGLIFFVLLGAAAASRDNSESICRPFDRKRSGLVMGEGAGVIILEEESHALKRGAKIYGELAGYGSSLDAYKVTAPDPKGAGAERSMKCAIEDAELNISDIDYINAHGTSTKLNDAAESLAIKNVFGEHADKLCISSTKSIIGHLLAASGAPEFIFTALSVFNDEMHPTINLNNPDPACDLDYLPNKKRTKPVRAALSNSFGFGGQNTSVIIKKYRGKAA
jgi:3-oxoacyl-[acyl-carrier-protein] synthase II